MADDLHYRLRNTQDELLLAMQELVDHAEDTIWLNDFETVFERLAYLFEVAGGARSTLIERWPQVFV